LERTLPNGGSIAECAAVCLQSRRSLTSTTITKIRTAISKM
jgi:hypothetical protein